MSGIGIITISTEIDLKQNQVRQRLICDFGRRIVQFVIQDSANSDGTDKEPTLARRFFLVIAPAANDNEFPCWLYVTPQVFTGFHRLEVFEFLTGAIAHRLAGDGRCFNPFSRPIKCVADVHLIIRRFNQRYESFTTERSVAGEQGLVTLR